jgi:hypothetical protein
MAVTRQHIQQKLDQLRVSIPKMIRDYENSSDFRCAFVGEAGSVMGGVSAKDYHWTRLQLFALLSDCGFRSPAMFLPKQERFVMLCSKD